MTRTTSKWLLAASVALLTACSADTSVLGPARSAGGDSPPSVHVREQVQPPPAFDREPSAVEQDELEDAANSQLERKPSSRFTRYAMAAS